MDIVVALICFGYVLVNLWLLENKIEKLEHFQSWATYDINYVCKKAEGHDKQFEHLRLGDKGWFFVDEEGKIEFPKEEKENA